MIDYIGQMLEQQLEREEREGTWKSGPVRVPLPEQDEEDARRGEKTEPVLLPGLESRKENGLLLTAERPRRGSGRGIRRWAAGLEILDQAGIRRTDVGPEMDRAVTEAAQSLDQAVRISLAGLPAAEGQARVVTLEPPGRGQDAGGDELQRLDRLVRRDARRFDGGFQLL